MHVERLELVSAFKRDPSVYLAKGPQLAALAKRYGGQIVSVNTPEHAPPELPRFVLRFERAVFQVALNRFQLVAEPPAHVSSSYEEAIAFAANLARPVLQDLFADASPAFEWTGIIASLNFPTLTGKQSAMQAAGPLLERLTTLSWPLEELATFELKVGRRTNGFFRNYQISGYEIREVAVAVPKGARRVELKLAESPVLEVGTTVTVDVNSRPAPDRSSAVSDLELTLAEHGRAVASLAADLNLEETL